jgi:hypothetical protein
VVIFIFYGYIRVGRSMIGHDLAAWIKTRLLGEWSTLTGSLDSDGQSEVG